MFNVAAPVLAEDKPAVEETPCALDPQCKMPFLGRQFRCPTIPDLRIPESLDRGVNFAFNSAKLTVAARKGLDLLAETLKHADFGNIDLTISGHTDGRGNVEYNQQLSQRRADAVRQYLIAQQTMNPERLTAKGYGKSQLLYPAEPGNELNRRVEFKVSVSGSDSPTQSDASVTSIACPNSPRTN